MRGKNQKNQVLLNLKNEAELQINLILNKFEEETGLEIQSLEIRHGNSGEKNDAIFSTINATL